MPFSAATGNTVAARRPASRLGARTIAAALAGAALGLADPGQALAGATFTLLHTFVAVTDGNQPRGGLVMDPAGALYGTASSAGGIGYEGTVYRLTPPAAGKTIWAFAVLHRFTGKADGGITRATLARDATGALYGTTVSGGTGNGVVFRLTPPAAGHTVWADAVLHDFAAGLDGGFPYGGVTIGKAGLLYGATFEEGKYSNGVVYQVVPPPAGHTIWTESVLASFSGQSATPPTGGGPYAEVAVDAAGALYGTTSSGGKYGAGAVYKLTPPASGKTAWTAAVLHTFTGKADGGSPKGGVILDAAGAVYGATDIGSNPACAGGGCGLVFKLTPPATGKTAWTFTALHKFSGGADGRNPRAALLMGGSGTLYGTASQGGIANSGAFNGYGVVFKLTPPATGSTVWKETVLYSFTGGNDGDSPGAPLIRDAVGALYGTTLGGGAGSGGTVFKVTP